MYCASRHISALSGKKNNRLFHDSILKIRDKTAENKPGILKILEKFYMFCSHSTLGKEATFPFVEDIPIP
jgi:hypothetical protein